MSQLNHQSILVIGAGNMGKSIAGGLIEKHWPAELITFCDNNTSRHDALKELFPNCHIVSEAHLAKEAPRIILLAVKPNDMANVCQSISTIDSLKDALYITVAAGLPISAYQQWLGERSTIIRCMPNTPAAIGQAMTGIYTQDQTSDSDRNLADQILSAIGKTLWVDKESKLDAVTAVSGSGPAYLFYLMECMQKAGEKLGLSAEQCYELTLQTMLGAAQLADQQEIDFETLRANVTSKGGTTEQALNCFQQHKLENIVEDALKAAATRAHQISQSFNKE